MGQKVEYICEVMEENATLKIQNQALLHRLDYLENENLKLRTDLQIVVARLGEEAGQA